jgi:hypothetical protein
MRIENSAHLCHAVSTSTSTSSSFDGPDHLSEVIFITSVSRCTLTAIGVFALSGTPLQVAMI